MPKGLLPLDRTHFPSSTTRPRHHRRVCGPSQLGGLGLRSVGVVAWILALPVAA